MTRNDLMLKFMKTQHLAVLVTSHNRVVSTMTCLKHLSLQTDIENIALSIYLVDDGSSDGTRESIQKNYPDVTIIAGDGDLFWNRGMHRAWEYSSKERDYDYYLWLNDDTCLEEDAISVLFNIANHMQLPTIIVGAIRPSNSTNSSSYGGYLNNTMLLPNGQIQKCDKFNGNCVLVPNEIFQKIGNLDMKFRHSFGDYEYGLRARKAGYKLVLTHRFVGVCDRNNWPPSYLSAKNSIFKRFRDLYSPKGFNPIESFYLNSKYYSKMYAILIFLKVHLNTAFPSITKQSHEN